MLLKKNSFFRGALFVTSKSTFNDIVLDWLNILATFNKFTLVLIYTIKLNYFYLIQNG